MKRRTLAPVHPGEILLEEFLKLMGLSQNRLALGIGVHPRRINAIVLGKRTITARTALRLAKYFNTSAKFWLGLQADYNVDGVNSPNQIKMRDGLEVRLGSLARAGGREW